MRRGDQRSPDVGKYYPKFERVEPDKTFAVFRDEHQHLGTLRKLEKEEQNNHVCMRSIKGINYNV